MKIANVINKRNRVLLRELVITDFKLRYQGSVLGYLWSLLKPLFLFAIMYVVFGQLLRFGSTIEHYTVYLLLGLVLWGFFTEATSNGLTAIVARGDLIRKISFPKYILVISATVSALINLGLNMIVIALFMVINGVHIRESILFFPLIILELYVLALALAFFLSALFIKFRDINYIWELVLQAAFYATPIFYTIDMVIQRYPLAAKLQLLNPVAQIIQDARYSLITPQAVRLYDLVHNPFLISVPFVAIAVIILLAVFYFKKHSKDFAENV